MAILTQHGGQCCGVWHLHGMDYTSIAELDERISQHFVHGNMNRVLEIILSARQVEDPRSTDGGRINHTIVAAGGWAAVLAQRGFRLTEAWTNSNSSRRCYRFIKLTEFLENAETHVPRAPRGFVEAGGVVQAAVVPNAGPARVTDVAAIVRNLTTRDVGVVLRSYINDEGVRMLVVRLNDTAAERRWASHNCAIVADAPGIPPVEEVINNRREEPPAPPRVVFSTFHNVFQQPRGRSNAGWDTYEQARQNAPRARQIDRRDIMSDGSVVWVTTVRG